MRGAYNCNALLARMFLQLIAPDCWSSSWASPLYAYAVVAFSAPVILIVLYFVCCSAAFYWLRHRVPVHRRVLMLLQGNVWRDIVGQRITISFSRLCLITLYLWSPIAATYFAATLPCRWDGMGCMYRCLWCTACVLLLERSVCMHAFIGGYICMQNKCICMHICTHPCEYARTALVQMQWQHPA